MKTSIHLVRFGKDLWGKFSSCKCFKPRNTWQHDQDVPRWKTQNLRTFATNLTCKLAIEVHVSGTLMRWKKFSTNFAVQTYTAYKFCCIRSTVVTIALFHKQPFHWSVSKTTLICIFSPIWIKKVWMCQLWRISTKQLIWCEFCRVYVTSLEHWQKLLVELVVGVVDALDGVLKSEKPEDVSTCF